MSLFSRIFGRSNKPQQTTRLEVTGRPSTFSAFSGDPWQSDVYRSAVDAIARVSAKLVLQPVHLFTDGSTAACDRHLAHVLQVEPNQHMTAYDMLYATFAQLYSRNNAFVYIQRNSAGQVVALWPLHVSHVDFAEARDGSTLCAFTFANGKTWLLPYSSIIHLRRHFNTSDILGDPNDAISPAVSLADAQNRGIEQSIRRAGSIRGIVRYAGNLGESQRAEYQRLFEETQLSASNAGGVVWTGAGMEFQPINETPATVNAEDVEAVKTKIYSYLGLSQAIVDSSFDDSTFGAFEESIIESLALQTSLEFTRKLYPGRHDRRIECSTTRISYMSAQAKTNLLKVAIPMGVLSVNEGRAALGLEPYPEDRVIQSLNYSNVDLVDKYQLASSGFGIKTLNQDLKVDEETEATE